ncbi:hypothetical protein HK436_21690 [Mesorhizobium sediminum]|nr:WecB/TagA/CpsF family glycosyltransferase [Mesorhizobium sediminum]NRC56021.1 hypothetical protein [Mesorhizobium sediminum]
MRNQKIRDLVPVCKLGGMANARLSLRETVQLMDDAIAGRLPELEQPLFMTSSNGQVLSMYARSSKIRRLFDQADVISADGQPMVTISHLLTSSRYLTAPARRTCSTMRACCCRKAPLTTCSAPRRTRSSALPRRSATAFRGSSLPATPTATSTRQARKHCSRISTGYGRTSCGSVSVCRASRSSCCNIDRLKSVKVVKTSGGLFNFLSGSRSRAPVWMQKAGLEWLYRTVLEPRRLAMRYLITNPHSLYLLLTRTG